VKRAPRDANNTTVEELLVLTRVSDPTQTRAHAVSFGKDEDGRDRHGILIQGPEANHLLAYITNIINSVAAVADKKEPLQPKETVS